MFTKLRSKLSPRQKHLIKYFIAAFSTANILSLLPYLNYSIKRNRAVREMWILLYPKPVTSGLRRIGGNKDGGYLIPNFNHVFDGLISPGVGDSFSFESDFVGTQLRAVLIDATVSKPTNLPSNMIFLSKMLGATKSVDGLFVTLQDIRCEYFAASESLALQMDIEGAEYDVLTNMQRENLAGLDLLLVEFHNLHKMVGTTSIENPLHVSLKLLSKDFELVHCHPNNAGGFSLHRFRVLPKVVETTWVRKGLTAISLETVRLPHEFDVANDLLIWDLRYPVRYK